MMCMLCLSLLKFLLLPPRHGLHSHIRSSYSTRCGCMLANRRAHLSSGSVTGGCSVYSMLGSLASLQQRSLRRSESVATHIKGFLQRMPRHRPWRTDSWSSDTSRLHVFKRKKGILRRLELLECSQAVTAQIPAKCSRRGSVVPRLTIPVYGGLSVSPSFPPLPAMPSPIKKILSDSLT
jgi:hypothetical protein